FSYKTYKGEKLRVKVSEKKQLNTKIPPHSSELIFQTKAKNQRFFLVFASRTDLPEPIFQLSKTSVQSGEGAIYRWN
ncbi:MAG: hypothetical protein ABJQ90_11035, partial [Parasphingorhabdus sp.]